MNFKAKFQQKHLRLETFYNNNSFCRQSFSVQSIKEIRQDSQNNVTQSFYYILEIQVAKFLLWCVSYKRLQIMFVNNFAGCHQCFELFHLVTPIVNYILLVDTNVVNYFTGWHLLGIYFTGWHQCCDLFHWLTPMLQIISLVGTNCDLHFTGWQQCCELFHWLTPMLCIISWVDTNVVNYFTGWHQCCELFHRLTPML